MGYFHSYRGRWVHWVAAFALLFQALIPLAQAIPVEDENGEFRTLVICTAYGLQQITLDGAGEAPTDNMPQESCPICMALSMGGQTLDTAIAVKLPVPAFVHTRTALILTIYAPSSTRLRSQSARAPPAFA